MAIIYAEDFTPGNSLFSDTYAYNRPTDGVDPLYPNLRGSEGVFIDGNGRLDTDPAFTGEFETHQQAGWWIKSAGAMSGGGPGGYAGPGFWNGTVGWIEALYYPTTESLTELTEPFVTAPMIQVTDPFAAFPFVGVDAQLDDAFIIVRHQNEGSHANEVTVTGATMPVAGEPYLVRLQWQCGTWDTDLLQAAADGYVRVYINEVLIYEATNISLYFAPLTVPANLIDGVLFGYFGLLGPLASFTINDEAYVAASTIQFRSGGTSNPVAWMEITHREIP